MPQISQMGLQTDETTLTKSGNTISIKDNGITSAKIEDGTIVNADINANAGISVTKLSGVVSPLKVLYVGANFNSSQSGAGTDEKSSEMTAITSTTLSGANYLRIITTYSEIINIGNSVSYKIQTKDIGGNYADSLAYITISDANWGNTALRQVTYIHTLTANEKSSGVQVKIFSKSVVASSNVATFTNIQTTIEVL